MCPPMLFNTGGAVLLSCRRAGHRFWIREESALSGEQVLRGDYRMVEWGGGMLVAGLLWRQGCVR